MHAFVASLTAAMLFGHAVLGCCAHHAHACGQPHGSLAVGDAAHGGAAGCGSDARHGSGETGTPSPEQDSCEGISCDFGPPTNAWDARSFAALSQLVASLPSKVAPPQMELQRRPERDAAEFPTAVRLHVAYQVLLI